MANMAAKDRQEFVLNTLDNELKQDTDSTLVREVAEHLAGAGDERAYRLLENLRAGFASSRTPL